MMLADAVAVMVVVVALEKKGLCNDDFPLSIEQMPPLPPLFKQDDGVLYCCQCSF